MRHPILHGAPALLLLGLLASLVLDGCAATLTPSTGDIGLDLRHDDPRFRIEAARAAADGKRLDLAAELVKNMSDSDPAVRMFTATALRKLTGQDFDFKAHGTVVERREAVARWERWLEETRRPAPPAITEKPPLARPAGPPVEAPAQDG